MGIDFGGLPEKFDLAITRYGFVVTPIVGVFAVAAKAFTNLADREAVSKNPANHGRFWNYCRERDNWEMGFLFIPILGSIYLLSRDRLESESLAKSTAKSNNEPLKDNRPEISGGKIKFKNYEFSITKINDDEYQCEGRTYSKESLIRHVRQQVMKKVRQGEMGD